MKEKMKEMKQEVNRRLSINKRRLVFSLLVMIVTLPAINGCSNYEDIAHLEENVNELERQIDEIKSKYDRVLDELQLVRSELRSFEDKLKSAEDEVEYYKNELDRLKNEKTEEEFDLSLAEDIFTTLVKSNSKEDWLPFGWIGPGIDFLSIYLSDEVLKAAISIRSETFSEEEISSELNKFKKDNIK